MWGDEVSSPEAGVTRIACIRRARGGGDLTLQLFVRRRNLIRQRVPERYRRKKKGESGGDPDCGDSLKTSTAENARRLLGVSLFGTAGFHDASSPRWRARPAHNAARLGSSDPPTRPSRRP